MKKNLFFVFLILFLIPISIKAASISNTEVTGNSTAYINDTISLTFNIKFQGITNQNDGLGIGGVLFEFSFDDSIFSIVGINENNNWETMVGKENNKYYVLSIISENNSQNKCIDGVLYCTDYSVTLKFYLNDTSKTIADFKMESVETVLFKINSDYEEKDAITIKSNTIKTHNVNISNDKHSAAAPPPSIVTESKVTDVVSKAESKVSNSQKSNNNNNSSKTTSKTETTTTKKTDAENNNLSSLEIENYKIKFDKEKLNYSIKLNKPINKLKIKAVAEDLDASVKIIGDEDLSSNDYKVQVIVTSQNGKKKVYTIKVNYAKGVKLKKSHKIKFKITKKIIKITLIGLLIIFVVGIIIFFISRKKDKKLDKMLNDLDKF